MFTIPIPSLPFTYVDKIPEELLIIVFGSIIVVTLAVAITATIQMVRNKNK